jgi:hypothetical protein
MGCPVLCGCPTYYPVRGSVGVVGVGEKKKRKQRYLSFLPGDFFLLFFINGIIFLGFSCIFSLSSRRCRLYRRRDLFILFFLFIFRKNKSFSLSIFLLYGKKGRLAYERT